MVHPCEASYGALPAAVPHLWIGLRAEDTPSALLSFFVAFPGSGDQTL
jgi:hypothetical protein